MTINAGRLNAQYQKPKDGDTTHIWQTHRNGSDVTVATLTLDGDELLDLQYIVNRAVREREGK